MMKIIATLMLLSLNFSTNALSIDPCYGVKTKSLADRCYSTAVKLSLGVIDECSRLNEISSSGMMKVICMEYAANCDFLGNDFTYSLELILSRNYNIHEVFALTCD